MATTPYVAAGSERLCAVPAGKRASEGPSLTTSPYGLALPSRRCRRAGPMVGAAVPQQSRRAAVEALKPPDTLGA